MEELMLQPNMLLQYLTAEFMIGVFIIALHQSASCYMTFYLLTDFTVQLLFGHSWVKCIAFVKLHNDFIFHQIVEIQWCFMTE